MPTSGESRGTLIGIPIPANLYLKVDQKWESGNITTQQEIQVEELKAWYNYTCIQQCHIQGENNTPFCKSNTTIDVGKKKKRSSRYKDLFGEGGWDEDLLVGFKATNTKLMLGGQCLKVLRKQDGTGCVEIELGRFYLLGGKGYALWEL